MAKKPTTTVSQYYDQAARGPGLRGPVTVSSGRGITAGPGQVRLHDFFFCFTEMVNDVATYRGRKKYLFMFSVVIISVDLLYCRVLVLE